jgi:hypothetical protein
MSANQRSKLALVAVAAFLVSAISLALAIKCDRTVSRRRAQLAALDRTTNNPAYRKSLEDLKRRSTAYSQPPPLWIAPDDSGRAAAMEAVRSEAQAMVNTLEGTATRARLTAEREILSKTWQMYVFYGLALALGIVGAITLRYRASVETEAGGNPLSVTGQ